MVCRPSTATHISSVSPIYSLFLHLFLKRNGRGEHLLCSGYILDTDIPQRYSGFGSRPPRWSKYCSKVSCNLFAHGGSCFQFGKTTSVKHNKVNHSRRTSGCIVSTEIKMEPLPLRRELMFWKPFLTPTLSYFPSALIPVEKLVLEKYRIDSIPWNMSI